MSENLEATRQRLIDRIALGGDVSRFQEALDRLPPPAPVCEAPLAFLKQRAQAFQPKDESGAVITWDFILPASRFIVSDAEASRLRPEQDDPYFGQEPQRCVCGELIHPDDEAAEVVRNFQHVLVHVNGCVLPGDVLA